MTLPWEIAVHTAPKNLSTLVETLIVPYLVFLNWNIGSLRRHFDVMQKFLFSINFFPTIIALTEARIHNDDLNYYQLSNYSCICNKVNDDNSPGGVCVYNRIISLINYVKI